VSKLLIANLLCGTLLSAQSGREAVPPISVHQYSGISPVSAGNDKLQTFDLEGHARIVRLRDAKVIAESAPYPEAHWDNADDDLMWVIGLGQPNIRTWRPSTGRYHTIIDYKNRFTTITTGATTDISLDDWEAFWAPAEHQVCAADLKAKKTYCLDYNAPNSVNKLGATKDIDYVAVTPRDSKSGLHYVLLMASPAMAVFSVDESAGTLRWIVRPEIVVPMMGSGKGNNDGNCDPGESCFTTPHGDVYTAPDGQVYFQASVGMEISLASGYVCESGQALMRVNAGLKMTTPENAFGSAGGGLKYVTDYPCGVDWSSSHNGCNRWGGHCVVSFATPAPQDGQAVPKKNEIWLIGLNASGTIAYSRLGQTSPSYSNSGSDPNLNYWSTARAAMSMDGTIVIFDSDLGTHRARHAVYSLPSGSPAAAQPSLPAANVVRPK